MYHLRKNMTRSDLLLAMNQGGEEKEKLLAIMYEKLENVYTLLFQLENQAEKTSDSNPVGALIHITAKELRRRLEENRKP